MLIDVAAHILPSRFYERLRQRPGVYMSRRVAGIACLHDLDVRFKVMDRFPEYRQVISLAIPPVDRLGEAAEDLTRLANDELAGLVEAHPDRFAGAWAGLPLNNREASHREIERIAGRHAFYGVQIYSNVAGRPLDEPPTLAVIEDTVRRRIPIFLHPARTATDRPDYPSEDRARYDLWQIFGWPYETTIAMARLVFTGLFDRYPDAVIVTHHLGAMVPYFSGRISGGYRQWGTRSDDPSGERLPVDLARPAEWYFTQFYADTALFGAPHGVRCGLEYFPPDRVMFGSDTPFDPEGGAGYIRETIADLDRADLDPARRRMVDEENFRRVQARRTPAKK